VVTCGIPVPSTNLRNFLWSLLVPEVKCVPMLDVQQPQPVRKPTCSYLLALAVVLVAMEFNSLESQGKQFYSFGHSCLGSE
jgi:hypothetical protein